MDPVIESLLLLALIFLASLVLTGLLRGYAVHKRMIDVSNPRGSHANATPRGGGIAIVLLFILASLWLWLQELADIRSFWAILLGGGAVAAVGAWDDVAHLTPSRRLLVHGFAASWAMLLFGGLPALPLGGFAIDLGWGGILLGVVGLTWLLNLYNFMDGVDGIAAVETITVSCGAAAIMWFTGGAETALWLLTLAAASVGFLVWNWPPAKIFMGDGGSGFVGFVFGVFAVASSNHSAPDR